MINHTPDRILGLIRKILAKTEEAGCTPAEAEVAYAKASRMLAEHNLSMEDVEVAAGRDGDGDWLDEVVHEAKRMSLGDKECLQILSRFFFVEHVISVNYDGTQTLHLFGKAENVATAKYVWGALRAAFDRHWAEYRTRNGLPAREKNLFVMGMASGFYGKLREEREAMEAERDREKPGSTELALQSIAEKLKSQLAVAYPDIEETKRRPVYLNGDESTLKAGMEAGRSLNLDRPLGENEPKRIAQ